MNFHIDFAWAETLGDSQWWVDKYFLSFFFLRKGITWDLSMMQIVMVATYNTSAGKLQQIYGDLSKGLSRKCLCFPL